MEILCLSNGHGEDAIAVRILEQLQSLPHPPKLAALPLVGEGKAYQELNIPIIGPVMGMPSGGFIYMDGRQLWQDVKGGLLQLTLAQYRAVRQWVKEKSGLILAVGDIVPLLFARLTGANYAFVGTAKSEYYLRDETGWLAKTSPIERLQGSVYLPWERFLLQPPQCRAIFPRDPLTCHILQKYLFPAYDLGNPMMDGIVAKYSLNSIDTLTILLLPGSRNPEAQRNWAKILETTKPISEKINSSVVFLGAIASSLPLEPFYTLLYQQGWQSQPLNSVISPITDPQAQAFTRENATLILTQNAYPDCLLTANLAIAMAGTATEQFVGLGKPVITLPGEGPQFTYAFAEAQTRLLGESVILVEQPTKVADTIQILLTDIPRMKLIFENGLRRMGKPGAAARIAQNLGDILTRGNFC